MWKNSSQTRHDVVVQYRKSNYCYTIEYWRKFKNCRSINVYQLNDKTNFVIWLFLTGNKPLNQIKIWKIKAVSIISLWAIVYKKLIIWLNMQFSVLMGFILKKNFILDKTNLQFYIKIQHLRNKYFENVKSLGCKLW